MDSYQTNSDTWNKLAAVYQDKFVDMDLYDATYDTFCGLLEKPHPKVLEIGCGPGNVTRYLLAKRPDFKIEAIDIAPNMVKLAARNNPAAKFRIMDCREIDKLADKFDAVMCGFCMPYLSKEDCAKLIKDCAFLLNSGGVVYFSTIEGDYFQSGYETDSSGQHKMYVYYHQEDHIAKELKENGFELIDLIRKYYPKQDGTCDTHMIFIAKKK